MTPTRIRPVVVFTGPTLAADDVHRSLPSAVVLPPVAMGDVYRAVVALRPAAMAIVDGFYETVPSVWHRELLYALSCGVHVFGAASMGALRAAELERYGMRGVGRIFEDFRDGRLTDDDEVAVLHAPAMSGYQAANEALVNIRATLTAAQAAGVLAPAAAEKLTHRAKKLFYAERTWEAVLSTAPPASVAAFTRWLATHGTVDQKRSDALALLTCLKTELALAQTPRPCSFEFVPTTGWQALLGEAEAVVGDS